ncbi:hypothetical protein Acr_17g0012730 [Actinidia rufa]|uniref:NAC domain-containing protein n=1 Tax=Actinidia rufa TaxID=165716 RepID=A0A7J0G4G8_9ERIC|nr:hypothetical protein Acr_17g0012730 [Actinidia rufa]
MAKRLRVGLKFRPTDQELINDYLFKKIVGEGLPFEGIILERDVYDQHVLSEIFQSWVDEDEDGDVSRDTQSYFFTRLKKKTANGETYCRTVGNGTWRSQYSRVIKADEYDDESIPIGIKRSLEYIDSGSVQHKNWIIMEFSLAGVSLEHSLSSKDYVICRLQKSRGGKHGNEAPVNTPSGCFNNKRIKLSSKQNQQTEPAPLVDETVATNTLATLPPSASYDLSECISMPPLVEDKPAATVDEEGGCTSRKQESIAAPKSLADDAVMDSIILLSTTVEGFAEDFIEGFVGQFLNGN